MKDCLDNIAVQVQVMGNHIPNLRKLVEYPCVCGRSYHDQPTQVNDIIMHLNDRHEWSFTAIADWLDTLGLDFSFPIPE